MSINITVRMIVNRWHTVSKPEDQKIKGAEDQRTRVGPTVVTLNPCPRSPTPEA